MTKPPYKVYKVLTITRLSFVTFEASLNKSLTYYVGNGWEVLSLTPTQFDSERNVLEMVVVLQKDKYVSTSR